MRHLLLVFCLLIFRSILLSGQSTFPNPVPATDPPDSTAVVYIENTRTLRFRNGVKELVGDVKLRQGDAIFYCDSAAVLENDVRAYGNVVIDQADSVFVYSDTLFYFGNERKATLYSNVRLTDSVQTLYTEKLDYDMNERIGTYRTGATIVNDDTKLTSKIGYYHVNTREAFFKEDVLVVDSNYTVAADTLKMNTDTRVVHFVGPTDIQTKENQIYCESGFYDTEKNYAEFEQNARLLKGDELVSAEKIRYDGTLDQAYLEGKSFIESGTRSIEADQGFYDAQNERSRFIGNVIIRDSTQVIRADSVDNYEVENRSEARGNVYLVDEAEDLQIVCEAADYNEETGYIKAFGRPLLTTLVDGDSLWLSADTLYSIKDTAVVEARTLIAWQDVRMYKQDLQSICDSLVYSTADSLFRFYDDPVLWSDTTQFTGDTVTVFMKEKQINRIDLNRNAFIINTEDSVYFNQIKGRDIAAFFRESDLRQMRVSGNGESVYYAEDDNGLYIGVNKTVCSEMLIFFGDNKVRKIHFYELPKATVFPMGQVSHKGLQMDGFKWVSDLRPRSKKELRFYEKPLEPQPEPVINRSNTGTRPESNYPKPKTEETPSETDKQ